MSRVPVEHRPTSLSCAERCATPEFHLAVQSSQQQAPRCGIAIHAHLKSNSAAIAELHHGAGDELHADAFPPLTRNGKVYGTRERSRSMKLGGISIKCPSSLPHKKVLHF